MNPGNRLLHLLHKPFPQEESRWEYYRSITVISVFVTFFLYVFEPFDIDEIESGKFVACLGFGLATFGATLLYDLVLRGLKLKGDQTSFTFGRWILYIIGVMLVISVANFLYVRLMYFGYIRWEFLPHMIRSTFAIGIFPVVAIGALALMRQEKKYQNIAKEINQNPRMRESALASRQGSIFDIPIPQIRYVEALQNYVKIAYLNPAGQLVEQTQRATLKGILEEAQGSLLVKCHRSYLVNRESIVSTSGNAQGLLLSLSDCEKRIPVSRSYVPIFRGV